jgi:hypothetical protein
MHIRKGFAPGHGHIVADDVHLEKGAAMVDKLLEDAGRFETGDKARGEALEAVVVMHEGEGVTVLAAVSFEGFGEER